ncbi:MAG TPA: glycine oxidase ThiO [Bryobacteraceae bacterium]|nr:glycine oxidase ThiO [Bryobacteraceae bacterium]
MTRGRAVAIAGAGIIGMSIAWRLAQRGWQVTVFDKGSIGSEASWAGAGMLSPGGEVERPSDWAALSIESHRLYAGFVRELEAESGVPIDYQKCGALQLAYSEREWEDAQARATVQASTGIETKPLTAKQVATFLPRIRSEDLAGALFYAGDAIVDPRDVMAALKGACNKAGVSVLEDAAVRRVVVRANDINIEAESHTETCGAVVIAAGAWSSSIEISGVPAFPAAEPVKGYLLGYRQPAQTCGTIVRHGHTYLLQRANGLLIAGSTEERSGFDRGIDPKQVEALHRSAAYLMPHLSETYLGENTPMEAWAGFRPASDALQLGSWHSKRVLLAYGHFRNGILLAPVTAERIADELDKLA